MHNITVYSSRQFGGKYPQSFYNSKCHQFAQKVISYTQKVFAVMTCGDDSKGGRQSGISGHAKAQTKSTNK